MTLEEWSWLLAAAALEEQPLTGAAALDPISEIWTNINIKQNVAEELEKTNANN